jgi:hypothetical protein
LDLSGEFKQGTITISQEELFTLQSSLKPTTLIEADIFPIEIDEVEWIVNPELESTLETTSITSNAVMSTLAVVSLPTSAGTGIALIKTMQMFDFLTFFNVQHPSNLASFLKVFNDNLLSLTPNPFEKGSVEDEGPVSLPTRILAYESEEQCRTNNVMRDNEFSCYLLNSAGDIVFHFFLYLILKVLLVVLTKIVQK